MSKATPKIAVYTVAVDWEGPLPPVPQVPEVDFLCFFRGQSPTLTRGWHLLPLEGFTELDGPRLSRLPKALPHLFLSRHQISIYIDLSVQLKDDFSDTILSEGGPAGISLVHLERNLGQEFEAVEARRYDSLYHLAEQTDRYTKSHPGFRELETFWGGLIVRNHFDQDVIDFGYRWALNIMRFSRRDQLSLPIALSNFPPSKLKRIEGSDEESLLHIRLKGKAKTRNYSLGDPIRFPSKNNLTISREKLYLAEIRSLQKFLGSRILDTAKGYFRRF